MKTRKASILQGLKDSNKKLKKLVVKCENVCKNILNKMHAKVTLKSPFLECSPSSAEMNNCVKLETK